MESKELATKQESATLAEVAQMKNMWDAPAIAQRDVMIPAILLLQPMSPQVTEGGMKFGQFIESLNNEVLGEMDRGFEIIPFKLVKVFIERIDNEDKDFLQVIPITPENESLPYNDSAMVDGKEEKIVRDRVLKFYVLLKSELDQGAAIPYTLSLKRSSYQAGQKLVTQMFIKNINSGKTPASMIMRVTCSKKTQDKKTWVAADIQALGITPDKYVGEAFRWLEIVNGGKAKEQSTEEVDQATGVIKDDIQF